VKRPPNLPLAPWVLVVLVFGCGAPAVEHRADTPLRPLAPAKPGLPTAPAPRYALPSCPLAYEAMIVESTEMEGAPPQGASVQTMMKIAMTADGARMQLAPIVVAQPALGRHRPFVFPQDGFAWPRLQTDGRAISEVDGPTQIWSAMGTQGGLVWFFPPMPESAAAGASTAWEIAHAVAADVLATESRRGTNAQRAPVPAAARSAPTERAAKPIRADVRFDHWSEERGQRVAHLTMTAQVATEESMPGGLPPGPGQPGMHMKAEGRWRGSYAVLPSGRLLSAEVQKHVDLTLDATLAAASADSAIPSRTPQKHTMDTTMKLHLVGACDGPTAPRVIPDPTREERAIVAYADTYAAIVQGNKDEALAGLDPALRKKQGDAALWAALSAYRQERGERALPPPVMLRDDDVGGDASGIRLKLQGSTRDGSTPQNVTTPLAFEVVLREEGGRFVVTSLRSELELAKGRLLDVSLRGIAVGRGWPPR